MLDRRGNVLEVQKTASLSLVCPFLRVVVAVEDDSVVLLKGSCDKSLSRCLNVFDGFELVCEFLELLGNNCVEHDVRAGCVNR